MSEHFREMYKENPDDPMFDGYSGEILNDGSGR